ncbi:MAG: Fic family protein [Actinomycetota bacterium]
MLPYDASQLLDLTAELDAWKERLDQRGVLPRAWFGRLRRDLEAEAIAASTSMEGVPVTVEEVRRILLGVRPTDVKKEDAALVEGYRDAMSFVLRRADAPAFRWNMELVIALHDRILAGSWGAGAGRFRDGPTYVVNSSTGELVFEPPDSDAVPNLVDRACALMEEDHPHPAIQAGWIHIALAAIHPFRDGNGRAARVAASLAMYRGGFKLSEFTSLEEWWGRHLPDYYASFAVLGEAFDPDTDVSAFLVAHVKAQLFQVRALDLREQVQRQIWLAIEQAIIDAGLEARVTNAAWDAFFGRDVTPRYYRPLADISAATATTDLAAAVAAGLLQPEGEGRSRRYLPGPRLYSLIAQTLALPDRGQLDPDAERARIVGELTKRATAAQSPVPVRE